MIGVPHRVLTSSFVLREEGLANYIKNASYSILSYNIISLPPIHHFVWLYCSFLQGIVSRDGYFISGLKNEINIFCIEAVCFKKDFFNTCWKKIKFSLASMKSYLQILKILLSNPVQGPHSGNLDAKNTLDNRLWSKKFFPRKAGTEIMMWLLEQHWEK